MGLLTAYKSIFAAPGSSTEGSATNHIFKSFVTGMGLRTPYFPQAILFYTIILPHHTDPATLSSSVFLMGFSKIALTLVWYGLLALAAKSVQAWLFNQRLQRGQALASACLLMGLGLALFLR